MRPDFFFAAEVAFESVKFCLRELLFFEACPLESELCGFANLALVRVELFSRVLAGAALFCRAVLLAFTFVFCFVFAEAVFASACRGGNPDRSSVKIARTITKRKERIEKTPVQATDTTSVFQGRAAKRAGFATADVFCIGSLAFFLRLSGKILEKWLTRN